MTRSINMRNTVLSVKHSSGGIMLWACFAASGIRYITEKILKLDLK